MSKMKVAIIGSGNRSKLYIDALKKLPDDFELVMMRFRTDEKAEKFKNEYDIPVTTSVEELIAYKPDFVVDVVNRPDVGKVAVQFLETGLPVLAETPAAESFEELDYMWNLVKTTGTKLLVAENYFAEPFFAAVLAACKKGYLGEVQAVTVSNIHEYHAASVIRMLLQEEYSPVSVIGKEIGSKLSIIKDKNGVPFESEKLVPSERYHVIMNYESGKTGIYDFAIPNYWSPIRQNFFLVQGPKGEIMNNDIVYFDDNWELQKKSFVQNKDENGNLVSISIGDDIVYENELLKTKGVGSNIGICHMLLNMKKYIETGSCPYTLNDAWQDTYYTQLFLEAGRRPFEMLHSEKKDWMP